MNTNSSWLQSISKIDFKNRRVQIATAIVIILILILLVFLFSGDDKDAGGGFRKTTTPQTKTTKPSSTPSIKQPCSLLSKEEATTLLGEEVDEGVNADIDKDTLRCRFDNTTSDGKYFLNINVYVFKTQKAYVSLKQANSGTEIETNVDDGFYAVRAKTQETERIIAIVSGDNRIAISASMALVQANGTLTEEELTIPDASRLAQYAGNIMAKLNN